MGTLGRRRPAAPARGGAGFTLLELLVVIVLAGLVLSMVSISVTPDEGQRLRREAERVGQLMALATDEARIRQQPIVWEADLTGYRFVTEAGGERRLLTGDDLLRERAWDQPLTRLTLYAGQDAQPAQSLLGPGAPPLRVTVAREWVQPRWRLELAGDQRTVTMEFDESGRGSVVQP